MKPTAELHALGQSLWLDNITRAMLDDGTLKTYISDLSVTGLTSNPSIFHKAISGSDAYDDDILSAPGHLDAEAVFARMALADLSRAADLFGDTHRNSNRMDGWVSMEVSPLLADDVAGTVQAAKALYEQGGRENLFIKIPGTAAGIKAIEETIHAGIPVNVTLLFSAEQSVAAAEAWMTGIERRLTEGLDPQIHSVLSLFISRWDVAVQGKVPESLHNRLGIAMAGDTLKAVNTLKESPRWKRLIEAGAPEQRLLWASTGTKDPAVSDVLYVEGLALGGTINTIPDQTLLAFADHGRADQGMAADGGGSGSVLAEFKAVGIDLPALAQRLQDEGAAAFVSSWRALMQQIDTRRAA